MFGFLAALGPVGIAAAVIGTVGTAIVASNSGSSGSSGSSDNEERARRRARRRQEESDRASINAEIDSFKSSSIKRIKIKYKEDITFVEKKLKLQNNHTSHARVVENHYISLEKDNQEIKKLIKELEKAKDEI